MIAIVTTVVAVIVILLLSFGKFARSADGAPPQPLASIIGSGFLICGPLLAREFGGAAFLAMAALLAIAYAAGAVIRFNIIHVERLAPTLSLHDPFAWAMRAAQTTLAIAYAVSVAYYLKLLAEFTMQPLSVPEAWHHPDGQPLVTVIIIALACFTFSGDIRKIEHAAHASVSVKIGIIAGLLAGLATWWISTGAPVNLPPANFSFSGIPLLLGLLITVQGFETSRYLGETYDQATRVRTMRYAQLFSSAIYLAFLALLTPLLRQAQAAEGVAGILDIMTLVAPMLGVFVLIGAVSSQLSAAIADSIGSGGLLIEVSRRRLGVRRAFIGSSMLAIAVVWLTDPFEVIALSSRAFALFYFMQAVLAYWVSKRTGAGGGLHRAGFVAVGLICLVAALAGAPAEG